MQPRPAPGMPDRYTVPHAPLARPGRRAGAVRRVPAGLQAARRPAGRVLRAGPPGRRRGAHHLRPLQRLLRRPHREEAAQPLPARVVDRSRSAPPAATWRAASARTGTSPSPRRSTRWPTRRRPRPSPDAAAELGCRSVAFTYNDPTIFLEYAVDVADACRERGHPHRGGDRRATSSPEPRRRVLPPPGRGQRRPQGLHRGLLPRTPAGPTWPPVLDTLEYLRRDRRVGGAHHAAHPRPQRQRRRARRHDAVGGGAPRPRRAHALHRLPPRLPHARRAAHAARHARAGPRDRPGATACATRTPATSTTSTARARSARPAASGSSAATGTRSATTASTTPATAARAARGCRACSTGPTGAGAAVRQPVVIDRVRREGAR